MKLGRPTINDCFVAVKMPAKLRDESWAQGILCGHKNLSNYIRECLEFCNKMHEAEPPKPGQDKLYEICQRKIEQKNIQKQKKLLKGA